MNCFPVTIEFANFKMLSEDKEFLDQLERYNPSLNILKSMELSFISHWKTQAAWEKKRKKKPVPQKIDWKSTIMKTIHLNKVYKTKEELNNDRA